MIHEGIEFHNISHTTTKEGCPGVSLHRIPDAVRENLNLVAQGVGLCPSHAEIRFITSAKISQLTLYSEDHHEFAFVYCGDFFIGEHCIEPNQSLTLTLERPSNLLELDSDSFRRFPVHLWRVRLSGTHRIHFVSLETAGEAVRPPTSTETPRHRWLAYGSSITHGFSASHLANPWTQLGAAQLDCDLLNLGFGGSCHVERAMADYISDRQDWNLCTVELGINLLDQPISKDEFRSRVAYLLDRINQKHPNSTLVVITPFLNGQDGGVRRNPPHPHVLEDFRVILREEVAVRIDRPHLRLLEGCEILDRMDGLTSDLCHPSDFGHALMAANFVRLLGPLCRPT